MKVIPHPSLNALAQECQEWLEQAQAKGKAQHAETALQAYLDTPGELASKAASQLSDLALFYDVRSCDAFFRSDTGTLAQSIQRAVRLRALHFRWPTAIHGKRHPLSD